MQQEHKKQNRRTRAHRQQEKYNHILFKIKTIRVCKEDTHKTH